MSDDIAKGMAVGDASAYAKAYDRYGPALYATALRMLGGASDAEDAIQDVFVSMVRSRERLAQVDNLKAYLFASLRYASMKILRSRQREVEGLDEMASEPPRSDPVGEDADRLWAAVARLPAAQREAVTLKISGELTFREIGLICGVTVNTAASRYRYGLERLKRMLEASHDER